MGTRTGTAGGVSGAVGANGTPSSLSTPQPDVPTKYLVPQWVASTAGEGEEARAAQLARFKDCHDDDKDAVLDLSMYTYLPTKTTPGEHASSGLTESDIKSAVGGTGNAGSALFSSSAAQTASDSVVASPNVAAAATSGTDADADGDVPMA